MSRISPEKRLQGWALCYSLPLNWQNPEYCGRHKDVISALRSVPLSLSWDKTDAAISWHLNWYKTVTISVCDARRHDCQYECALPFPFRSYEFIPSPGLERAQVSSLPHWPQLHVSYMGKVNGVKFVLMFLVYTKYKMTAFLLVNEILK